MPVAHSISSGVFVSMLAAPLIEMGDRYDVGVRLGMFFTILALGARDGSAVDAHGLEKEVQRAAADEQVFVFERGGKGANHEADVAAYYGGDVFRGRDEQRERESDWV